MICLLTPINTWIKWNILGFISYPSSTWQLTCTSMLHYITLIVDWDSESLESNTILIKLCQKTPKVNIRGKKKLIELA